MAGKLDRAEPAPNAGHGAPAAPAITLPKGGGAIRGIGEKFAANPVTGTGTLSVPISTSPGRSGFGPTLALSYDSGAGNGPFGLGWGLGLPAITRKTEQGLPRYRDDGESDVFLLSGAEDLVPVLEDRGGSGRWERHPEFRTVDGAEYRIDRYRPRVEGLFARIERWTHVPSGATHWRSVTRDNVTTLYGTDATSRVADPADDPARPARVFSWLVAASYDDRGNAIVYEYKGEDSDDVDGAQAHERNRTAASRSANRYLKRVKYGNRVSRLVEPDLSRAGWMFEVVLDYGEHDPDEPTPRERSGVAWPCRHDPFSTYRPGFEVRTYRLCQRVLMFHHFPGEDGVGRDCLVRSTDFVYRDARGNPEDRRRGDPVASALALVWQRGYKRRPGGGYLTRSLPPLAFEYTEVNVREDVRALDAESLENLPVGLDGTTYRWADLDGEGLSGILTEQGDAWYYKPNLGDGRFGPSERVTSTPSLAALGGGGQQLLDLAGDGQLDLVDLAGPTPGFFERTHDGRWDGFTPFASLPNVAWNDPNLRFVDLDGDGHADVLISEREVFTWHPSLAEDGFGTARRVHKARDEERGPTLVLADGTQSVYLADMSGGGLTDLVRVRNGEVCYWPNLGHGRFGAKVTMDDAPWFDPPDQFDQRRVRLADIDGSGTTDIIYLGRDGVRLYFNQSGNRWSAARRLGQFPRVDDLSSVTAVDLLGNGTACLVWSSPLAGDARRPVRYVDLMGGQKPHLLVRAANNLGAETRVEYAPSTRFYLRDKRAGTPWATRLPFPVHCVARVTVADRWRQTEFSTTYSYHHGHFDGVEREFRGFGRVEQVDAESYGAFARGNAASPCVTERGALYQPPTKTVTWFHTGAADDRGRVRSRFAGESFPRWFEDARPDEAHVLGAFREHAVPAPDLPGDGLTAGEWREARRACKGLALRREVYELDVDALEAGEHRPVKLFSAAAHTCQVRRLQPRAGNRHAVFLTTEREAVTYHYELDLRGDTLRPDPRVAHTLTLSTDEYGNALQSVAVVYPRLGQHEDDALAADDLARIRRVQREQHVAYTEHRYTNDVAGPDDHRLRVPCEVRTYELTGAAPRDGRYYTLGELRQLRLSTEYQPAGDPVAEIAYHETAGGAAPQKRCVEHVRTLFFADDLGGPLAFGRQGRLGLPYESYTLALTDALLRAVFAEKLTDDVRATLADAAASGYLGGRDLAARFAGLATDGQHWRRSGVAGFAADAARHFYLPEQYTDAFGNATRVAYDPLDLFVASSVDPLGNATRVTRFDYRVLAPREVTDANDNLLEAYFDVLGLPAATAVRGKGDEGDTLGGFDDALANPDPVALAAFFAAPTYDEAQSRRWLGDATARHVYHFGEVRGDDGTIAWGAHPACACGILRERHVARLAAGEESPLRAAFEYSDGLGSVLVTKAQAEPAADGGPLRWIASGRTVLNNKGKPVKQYEPYFSEGGHRFEEPRDVGVTPVLYYDAVGRLVRTEAPDGSYSRAEFSPWHIRTFDANDTVLEPGNAWYARRSAAAAAPEEQRAARLAARHAGTPTLTVLDSLGREVIAVAHNRTPSDAPEWADTPLLDRPWHDERYATYTKLDADGKPLWVRDARGNLVMQYVAPAKPTRAADEPDPADAERMPAGSVPCYDVAGNLLFHHSMDAGDRWTLNDAAGKAMLAWDVNDRADASGAMSTEHRRYRTTYDALRRPLETRLTVNDGPAHLIEQFVYGEPAAGDAAADAEAKRRNLRGQLHRHYDAGGLVAHTRFDFSGNLTEAERTLASAYRAPVVDWSEGSPTSGLEGETFRQTTEHDALGRMTRQYAWHGVAPGSRVAVYEPRYNARGLLAGEDLVVRATTTDGGYAEGPEARRTPAVRAVAYDAKGQLERIRYGNNTVTRYHYDAETFRLLQLRTTRPGSDPAFPGHRAGLRDGNVLQQLHYTYDPAGNITEIHDEAFEPVYFQNQEVLARSRYVYDALYRLVEATGRENGAFAGPPPQLERAADVASFPVAAPGALRDHTQRYRYDAVGNIAEMRHLAGPAGSWTRHYAYAADSNRLLRTWVGSDELRAVRYAYDRHGSMLNLANAPEAFRLRWDHRDMIHRAELGGGGVAYYAYDAGKERTRKVVESRTGAVQWERWYLGGVELYREYDGVGVVSEEIETHHLFVGSLRVLLVEDVLSTGDPGTRVRYQYHNHLGSSCVEADGDARVIACEAYHPYGTSAYQLTRGAAEARLRRYRYTGKERDAETGLSYHSARYYAPWLGRWMSTDPATTLDGVNLYRYCRNAPTRFADRGGTQAQEPEVDAREPRAPALPSAGAPRPPERGVTPPPSRHGSASPGSASAFLLGAYNLLGNSALSATVTGFRLQAEYGARVVQAFRAFPFTPDYWLRSSTGGPINLGRQPVASPRTVATALAPAAAVLRSMDRILAPIGLVSGVLGMRQAASSMSNQVGLERVQGVADYAANAWGVVSSSITMAEIGGVVLTAAGRSLLTWGGSALATGAGTTLASWGAGVTTWATSVSPVGAVLAAGAGGYALGTLINSSLEAHGWTLGGLLPEFSRTSPASERGVHLSAAAHAPRPTRTPPAATPAQPLVLRSAPGHQSGGSDDLLSQPVPSPLRPPATGNPWW